METAPKQRVGLFTISLVSLVVSAICFTLGMVMFLLVSEANAQSANIAIIEDAMNNIVDLSFVSITISNYLMAEFGVLVAISVAGVVASQVGKKISWFILCAWIALALEIAAFINDLFGPVSSINYNVFIAFAFIILMLAFAYLSQSPVAKKGAKVEKIASKKASPEKKAAPTTK